MIIEQNIINGMTEQRCSLQYNLYYLSLINLFELLDPKNNLIIFHEYKIIIRIFGMITLLLINYGLC